MFDAFGRTVGVISPTRSLTSFCTPRKDWFPNISRFASSMSSRGSYPSSVQMALSPGLFVHGPILETSALAVPPALCRLLLVLGFVPLIPCLSLVPLLIPQLSIGFTGRGPSRRLLLLPAASSRGRFEEGVLPVMRTSSSSTAIDSSSEIRSLLFVPARFLGVALETDSAERESVSMAAGGFVLGALVIRAPRRVGVCVEDLVGGAFLESELLK